MMRHEQFGEPGLIVEGITIHNTGNNLSARELADYMNACSNNNGTHFFVDEKEIVQVMPLDWITFHTGKGYDFGNLHTIAIEICRSQSDLYVQAQSRAKDLIAGLMALYNLDPSRIYFHNSFNPRAYCPHRILDTYGSRDHFLQEELSWHLK